VNNLVSPVLFQEALNHVPSNAIVIEIAPHSLLQAVLRRGLASTCTIVGLMDRRQPDNMNHLLSTLGKLVLNLSFCYKDNVAYIYNAHIAAVSVTKFQMPYRFVGNVTA